MKKVPFDCIAAYRLNPQLSGVAKFNAMLAERLRLPVHSVFDDVLLHVRHPLFSFKISDFAKKKEQRMLMARLRTFKKGRSFSLFLHTFAGTMLEREIVSSAQTVYCGNREIYKKLSAFHPHAIELWSPSLLIDTRPIFQTEITVFCFGMAHKIQGDMFAKLHRLLEKTEKTFSLLMSTAFHESVTLEESTQAFKKIEKIFGERFYHLGFLSDVSVAYFLRHATFFTAFFEGGVKNNNSTVNAAMAQGAAVITNLGRYSPLSFIHLDNMIDINQCTALPLEKNLIMSLRRNAHKTSASMDMETLVERMSVFQ